LGRAGFFGWKGWVVRFWATGMMYDTDVWGLTNTLVFLVGLFWRSDLRVGPPFLDSVAHERLHVQVIFSNLGQKSVTRS
jgi:hypothetical protein